MKLQKSDIRLFGLCAIAVVGAGVFRYVGAGDIVPFAVAAAALALLAVLVGRSVEALGDRLGPGATGVQQSGKRSERCGSPRLTRLNAATLRARPRGRAA